ncbi:pilus (MSHA type) biogenesis protein MshL [Thiobacter aerophilum]|uniref:Type IV pilus biogenesis and competence protein PilQ n=1 Tax=Thiobacter aerophilum TaxID=3121275 RepID=A0ABV0EHL5_9BURK
MKKILYGLVSLLLVGCATLPERKPTTLEQIDAALAQGAQSAAKPATPTQVTEALIPPLKLEVPPPTSAEPRFDLVVNNAPANQVFMGIVHGTRYSMLVHPEVSGSISVNLKDVTVKEALDAIRELYGYDYRIEGNRIFVQPLTMQTRVFQVNYLTATRKGTSDLRVVSGSVSDAPRGASPGVVGAPVTQPGATTETIQSTRVSTQSDTNFWTELTSAVRAIVGSEGGRSVVVSPQSGVIVVRALPNELRAVEQYLRATQGAVDRQVILEAKIIEVRLNDEFQSGINWAAFDSLGRHRFSVGADAGNLPIPPGSPVPPAGVTAATLGNTLGVGLQATGRSAAGLFGIAFQTGSFAALMQFLQTQGAVHVLSSPRIATLNNQKAVLKVGTDDFFVTNVSTTITTGTAASTPTTPNVTLQPFFSGIVLDVTPQIDDEENITLHIHPAVSKVTTNEKEINLGTAGQLKLPLASSTVSETDSIIRTRDGQVVAIGGLMKSSSEDGRVQVPGVGEVPVLGELFKNRNRRQEKSELVILLKATVVKGGESWAEDILESRRNIQRMTQ